MEAYQQIPEAQTTENLIQFLRNMAAETRIKAKRSMDRGTSWGLEILASSYDQRADQVTATLRH
jgi:hypothetical protein